MKKSAYFRNSLSFHKYGYYTIGIALLMMCILTFLALPLATAMANYQNSKKEANRISTYYLAEEIAYDRLALIDRLLISTYISSENKQDYFRLATSQLEGLEFGNLETDSSYCRFSWKETIPDCGYIQIQLEIEYPEEDTESFYQIKKWRTIYTTSQ